LTWPVNKGAVFTDDFRRGLLSAQLKRAFKRRLYGGMQAFAAVLSIRAFV